MELKRNLADKNNKSLIHTAIGIVFIAVGLYYMIDKMNNKTFDQFDWAYLAFYAVFGFKYLIQGVIALIRRPYILINNDKISLKPDASTPGKTIWWRDIQSITLAGKNFKIRSSDNSSYTIHLSYYNYEVADEIKVALETIASEKAIQINEQQS